MANQIWQGQTRFSLSNSVTHPRSTSVLIRISTTVNSYVKKLLVLLPSLISPFWHRKLYIDQTWSKQVTGPSIMIAISLKVHGPISQKGVFFVCLFVF